MSGLPTPKRFFAGYIFDLDGTVYLGEALLPTAGDLLGGSLEGDLDLSCFASELQEGATRLVVITRGAQGLVLVMGDERVVAVPPQVEVRSPVGAGDATLAGLLWAVSEQCDPAMMARRAVACGTAAAMQEGSGVGEVSLVRELLAKVEVRLG